MSQGEVIAPISIFNIKLNNLEKNFFKYFQPKENYELRIRKGSFTYDLFFTYKDTENKTYQWTTYHERSIFR